MRTREVYATAKRLGRRAGKSAASWAEIDEANAAAAENERLRTDLAAIIEETRMTVNPGESINVIFEIAKAALAGREE